MLIPKRLRKIPMQYSKSQMLLLYRVLLWCWTGKEKCVL